MKIGAGILATVARICCALACVALCSCAGGRFVGAHYVPSQMYPGEGLPDSKIATVYWGKLVDYAGTKWKSPILGVDGVPCKGNSFLYYSDPGQSWCGLVVQVLPGQHSFTVLVRTEDRATISSSSTPGVREITREWQVSKPFSTAKSAELKAGYVYAAIPVFSGKSFDVQLHEICRSADHITTARSDILFNKRECPEK